METLAFEYISIAGGLVVERARTSPRSMQDPKKPLEAGAACVPERKVARMIDESCIFMAYVFLSLIYWYIPKGCIEFRKRY